MKWRIMPFSGDFDYSQEIKDMAKMEALRAVNDMKVELTDEGELDISKLGEKWRRQISSIYSALEYKFKDSIDKLIIFSDQANNYACNYEASLRSCAAKQKKMPLSEAESKLTSANGCDDLLPCGSLLAQHYLSYCQAIAPDDKALSRMPPTGDILRALGVNRAMQAALIIDKYPHKALDLLCDASSALHLAGTGESKLDSFIEYKESLRKKGREGGKNRHAGVTELKKWTIDKYEKELGEKKWKSANAAAHALKDEVIAQGRVIGRNSELAPSNAQRTIATWISEHRKSV